MDVDNNPPNPNNIQGDDARMDVDIDNNVQLQPANNQNDPNPPPMPPNDNHPGANPNPIPNFAAALDLNPAPRPRPMRCKTKKLVATFHWEWDENAAECGICRNLLVIRCNECQVNGREQDVCVAAHGACNHVYHEHCISRWLQRQNTCPIDSTPWVLIRLGA